MSGADPERDRMIIDSVTDRLAARGSEELASGITVVPPPEVTPYRFCFQNHLSHATVSLLFADTPLVTTSIQPMNDMREVPQAVLDLLWELPAYARYSVGPPVTAQALRDAVHLKWSMSNLREREK